MNSDFKFYSLKELVNIKYGKDKKNVEDLNGKYPILGTGGIIGYANTFLYNKPSVLIGRKGTIDKVKYIEEPFWTVDTLFYTEINEDIVFPKFLYYLLSQIDFSIYNEGTSIPSLRTDTLNRLEFPIPDLNYQKNILNILNPIDFKIEINKKINHNLPIKCLIYILLKSFDFLSNVINKFKIKVKRLSYPLINFKDYITLNFNIRNINFSRH
ncbi:restriction endonuclease subunit S [Methanobrevibacter woesei]|uniref:restriction endonuclease subunit S n=1 Tax=Methanobrevibacter woesei TaxID=190976 RepID=UPI0026DF72FB|nr:restriction endonuclease subunit S [Methanobrevibacter woesei]